MAMMTEQQFYASQMMMDSSYGGMPAVGSVAPQAAFWVPCDIFPTKAATVHCNWCQCNFSDEAAELLRRSKGSRYFSHGEAPPKPHKSQMQPTEAQTTTAGIGVVLERDTDGRIRVKQVAPGGSAARQGSLLVGDIIAMVDGRNATELGKDVTRYVIGPEGTFVELVVERSGQILAPMLICRGAGPNATGPRHLPKSYEELPFYYSEEDKKMAADETLSKVKGMRAQFGLPEDRSEYDPASAASAAAAAAGTAGGVGGPSSVLL